MLYCYEATHISFDDSDDALTVGFGCLPDEDDYPTISLLLQRSTDEDEDVPSIEGAYVEWCSQENSCYGCVEDFVLERRSARIKFTEGANLLAGLEGDDREENTLTGLLITFDIDDAKYQELKDNLSNVIFSGCACFKAVV